MAILDEKILKLLRQHGFVVVSTIDVKDNIHCAAKGIVGVDPQAGKVYIIDLYHNRTFRNLNDDPRISITAIDDKLFEGYTLQGKAKIVPREEIKDQIIQEWEQKVIDRVTKRIIKGVQEGQKSQVHYEMYLPQQPAYLIEVNVENIIDLSPGKKTYK